MIYQVTEGLDHRLAKTGCYFLEILRVFAEVASIELSVEDINEIFNLCVKKKYVDQTAYIKKSAIQCIAQVASNHTGHHVHMRKISRRGKYTHVIALFHRFTSFGKEVFHFVGMSQNSTDVVSDPYSPNGSKTVRIGKIKSYRYIYAVARCRRNL